MRIWKRILFILLLGVILIAGTALPAYACTLNLTPDRTIVAPGDIVTFVLERTPTHRNCTQPLESTTIAVSGGEIVDSGAWQKGAPDRLVFKVRFNQPGTGTVTVLRNCDRTPGLQISASVQVNNTSSVVPDSMPATQNNTDPDTGITGNSDTGTTQSNPETGNYTDAEISVTATAPGEDTSLLPAWLRLDSNWVWWTAFFAVGLLLFRLGQQSFRSPLLMTSLVVLGFYLGACPCPLGAVFNVALLSVSVVFLILLITAMVWGRFFCGWICPMGAVQEFLHLRDTRWHVSGRWDHWLKYSKYAVLITFLLATIAAGYNIWRDIDPFRALFNFDWSLPAMGILAAVLLVNLIIERAFCRYLCPLGALLAIVNRLRTLFGQGSQVHECSGCQKCVKQGCPVDAIVVKGSGKEAIIEIDQNECVACGRCASTCAKKCICL